MVVSMESPGRKKQLLCGAICYGVCALVMGSLLLARFANISALQSDAYPLLEKAKVFENDEIIYDLGCGN